MSWDKKYDGRDLRRARFYWVDEEVLYRLTPLIGREAAWLYTVLCNLLSRKERNLMLEDLSQRTISRYSGFGVGTVSYYLRLLTTVGMISEIKGIGTRPSEYCLEDIPSLLALGEAELIKRLSSVREWSASREGKEWRKRQQVGRRSAETRSGSDDSHATTENSSEDAKNGPIGDSGASAQEPNASHEASDEAQKDEFSEEEPELVFGSGDASSRASALEQNTKGVFPSAKPAPLINKSPQDQIINPLTPKGLEPAWEDLVLPNDDLRLDSRHFPMAVGIAARWVMRVCGITERELQPVIIGQLELRCQQTGETLQVAAGLAASNARIYEEHAREQKLAMRFGWRRFFGEGHWQKPETWQLREVERPRLFDPGVQQQQGQEQIALHTARDRERVVAYVTALADKYESAGLAEAAVKIRTLVAESDWIFTELEDQLQAIEDEATLTLMEEAAEPQLGQWTEEIRKKYGEALRKMPPEKAQQAIEGRLRQLLLDERGLPRLSLFYAA